MFAFGIKWRLKKGSLMWQKRCWSGWFRKMLKGFLIFVRFFFFFFFLKCEYLCCYERLAVFGAEISLLGLLQVSSIPLTDHMDSIRMYKYTKSMNANDHVCMFVRWPVSRGLDWIDLPEFIKPWTRILREGTITTLSS